MSDRRTFLTRTGGCLAQLAVLDAMGWMGPGLFAADRPTRIVQEVPWGRLEEVAEGVWALISTPLEDRRTLCNGGIVEGRDGVCDVYSPDVRFNFTQRTPEGDLLQEGGYSKLCDALTGGGNKAMSIAALRAMGGNLNIYTRVVSV